MVLVVVLFWVGCQEKNSAPPQPTNTPTSVEVTLPEAQPAPEEPDPSLKDNYLLKISKVMNTHLSFLERTPPEVLSEAEPRENFANLHISIHQSLAEYRKSEQESSLKFVAKLDKLLELSKEYTAAASEMSKNDTTLKVFQTREAEYRSYLDQLYSELEEAGGPSKPQVR